MDCNLRPARHVAGLTPRASLPNARAADDRRTRGDTIRPCDSAMASCSRCDLRERSRRYRMYFWAFRSDHGATERTAAVQAMPTPTDREARAAVVRHVRVL